MIVSTLWGLSEQDACWFLFSTTTGRQPGPEKALQVFVGPRSCWVPSKGVCPHQGSAPSISSSAKWARRSTAPHLQHECKMC